MKHVPLAANAHERLRELFPLEMHDTYYKSPFTEIVQMLSLVCVAPITHALSCGSDLHNCLNRAYYQKGPPQ